MNNTMIIDGCTAVIAYDSDIEMFRGEFMGLNGGADFYAKDVEGLRKEGEISLRVFKEMCEKDGVPVKKQASGNLMLRIPPEVHQAVLVASRAQGTSLNQWAAKVLAEAAEA